MGTKYEWEETKDDDNLAKGGIAALGLALLGLGAKAISDHSKNKKAEEIKRNKAQIQAQIDRKTDQYRTLDAKFFKSSAEKNEIERLRREIVELKNLL